MNESLRHPMFDRTKIKMKPLAERQNRIRVEQQISPAAEHNVLSASTLEAIREVASRIQQAKRNQKAIILAFGAHTIKNGLGALLIRYLEQNYVTHLATNGAGVIHDWEFAYQGETSEHVQENLSRGEFGNWQETGFYINLALIAGAYSGLGYGDSIGRLIAQDRIDIPTRDELRNEIANTCKSNLRQAAAAADFLDTISRFELQPGIVPVNHAYKPFSIQAAAYRLGIPFTAHPMFGHDIIYNHPASLGAAVGRCAERDFLSYAHSVSQLDGGIYLSIGSAVMSPMIFEKSMSMAQNVALHAGSPITNHRIVVVDLQKSSWDWSQGEPAENHPDYYLRFNKTFSRARGKMSYLQCDNRDFLLTLYQILEKM
jgi:hypothetical protein